MNRKKSFMIMLIVCALSIAGCRQVEDPDFVVTDETAYVFPDGTSVSAGSFRNDSKLIYRLSDGTELLAEAKRPSVENCIVGNNSTLQTMSAAAREKVVAFYEQRGLLYSVEEYLLKAYQEYTTNRSAFECYFLSQETCPNASSEAVLYCTTEVLRPLGNGNYDEYFITQAFDIESGDVVDHVELFSADIDTVTQLFLSQYTADEDMLKVLSENFHLQYIRFFPDGYEVVFPHEIAERLNMSGNIRFGGLFTEEILSAFNTWAVPV